MTVWKNVSDGDLVFGVPLKLDTMGAAETIEVRRVRAGETINDGGNDMYGLNEAVTKGQLQRWHWMCVENPPSGSDDKIHQRSRLPVP